MTIVQTRQPFTPVISPSKKEDGSDLSVKDSNSFSLTNELEDNKTAQSFDSMEGTQTPSPKTYKEFIREDLPIIGCIAASVGHLIAGAGRIFDFIPAPITELADNHSLRFSKLVNVANYTYKGAEALLHKRAWEGISRLAYTAIVPWVPLESVFTYSGISSGLTMFEQGQRHLITYKNATEESPHGSPGSLLEDLKENSKAFIEMCKETFNPSSLWGKDRKIFVHPENPNDKGNTMFFSAWGNFTGALLGMLVGSEHSSFLGRIAAIDRNAGGVGCDWAKFFHPDKNNKLSGIFYAIVSIFDVAKSFTEEATSHTLSHFSMSMNNFANYYYVNTTKATIDNTYKGYRTKLAA